MRTRCLSIVLLLVSGTLLAGLVLVPVNVSATTLYVGGGGPGNYTTIQAAIDSASPGDTIFVFNGTYQENVLIDKTLSLIGEDRNATTIDRVGDGDAINITANWVNITGFNVMSNEGYGTGIRIANVGNCTVAGNYIRQEDKGILLSYASDNAVVGNALSNNWGGLYLFYSNRNEVLDNYVSTGVDGIRISGSDDNTLRRNTVTNVFDGIALYMSDSNTIINNSVSDNVRYGIYLHDSNNNVVIHNNLWGNKNSQARQDYGHDNKLDDGYPSGGNYYGNCADVMWGWNQDHPGSDGIQNYPANDGICDSPVYWGIDYNDPNFSTFFIDQFPLAYPFGSSFTLPDVPRKWHIYGFGLGSASSSLALNKSGNPHIALIQNDELKHATWTNGTWSIQTVDSNASRFYGWDPSIAIDSNDHPQMSYITTDGLRYARWNGSSWETELVDPVGKGETSIALDQNDRPHIAYSDYTLGAYHLKHANWTGSSWNIETVDYSKDDWSADIAIDSRGYPHLSYAGGSWSIRHANWTGSEWKIETVGAEVGEHTSIALDANDRPHISYIYDWTLKYAKWTGSSWKAEDVDGHCYVSEGSSIALDSKGLPHITYRNHCNNLRYARWTGSMWKNETVHFYAQFAFSTSLALDQYDKPHVSYWTGGLAYAARTDRIFFYEPPYPPRNLKANPGDRQVTLTWKEPKVDWGLAITNYTIYRGTSPGGEVFLADVGNVLNYTDTNLTNGQTYYYQVSAWNEAGESARSSEVNAIPSLRPGPPTNLTAESQYGDIALSWSPPLDDGGSPVTNYRIFRSTAPGEETFLVEVGNELGYLDTGVTIGITYYYQVSAVNGAGEGARSVEVSATATNAPSAPMNLTARADIHKVVLTWEAPACDGGMPVVNYTVYRGTYTNPETVLAEIGNVLTYTDTEVRAGRTYYYRVSAKNAVGEGPKSNEVNVTPLPFTLPRDLVGIRMWGEEPPPICAIASDIMACGNTHEPLANLPRYLS